MNLQYIADGLLLGATIGLGAIGLTLTYSILRFANFTQGDLMSWGAYLTLTLAGAIGGALSAEVLPLGPFSFGWPILLASSPWASPACWRSSSTSSCSGVCAGMAAQSSW